jgi:predicted esterase
MMSQPSRFTEQVDFRIELNADLAASVKTISDETAQRTAECAYAAQAACAEAERLMPELAKKPRIAMGFSGGAMTLPTVIAREHVRYAAAIMIGGGADFWLLTVRSNYTKFINAAQVSWVGRDKTDADERAVDELYLRTTPLDSFHTAAALVGKPVLMILGANDLAVPTALGEVLWKRIGEPHAKSEKWIRPGGHEVLFMNLRHDYENIISWIDRAAPKPVTEAIPSIPVAKPESSQPASK